jgi:hypothetical protein
MIKNILDFSMQAWSNPAPELVDATRRWGGPEWESSNGKEGNHLRIRH